MSEASDKHDEQCANLKKAAAICEQRGQGLVDSVIALQAKVDALTAALELASLNFNRSTKYGKGWHDALAYVKQAALKQEGEL